MKNGICPKCEAKKVHLVENTSVETSVGISWMSSAFISYYICTNCGYIELFISDMKDLPKIAEKYPKVK